MAVNTGAVQLGLWAKLDINYFKDEKIIEVGVVCEAAFLRLIAIARALIESADLDGAIPYLLAKRELRDVQDLNEKVDPGASFDDLMDSLAAAGLITLTANRKTLLVAGYGKWQTSSQTITDIRAKATARQTVSRAKKKQDLADEQAANEAWDEEQD